MKLIKKIAFVIIAFFALDFLLSTVLHGVSSASNIRYSKLFNQSIDADVVFIGNSRAVNTFYVPYLKEKFGFRAINLAYNDLSAPLMELFIKEYLQRNKPPEMIVLEVTALQVDYEGVKNFKQYFSDSSDLALLLKQHFPETYYTLMVSKTFAYNSEYFLRTLYYLNGLDQSWINHYQISLKYYDSLEPISNSFHLLKKIDQSSMFFLQQIIKLCRQHDIKLKLVLAPILDKKRNKEQIKGYLNDIENRSQLAVSDLSSVINEISFFSDTIHTNEQGAKRLADYLQEIKFFDLKNKKY